ncbi:helix-turn-helix transcriptional regulator [Raoultibacter phocaeensis]|uniref:helix-turn-helix transcriptional regulator n=1 Tax=Raoultibacter phocaeensis TaxID=2479841 RepID=UPI0015D57AA8|nr:helix-turn-helix transcriptional regulator [Raoultibacter phocaeensis]
MKRIDHLEQMIPYLFALGCARAWLTLLFAEPAIATMPTPFNPHVFFDYSYALAGIAVALAARRIAPLQENRWAKPLALVLCVAASACMLTASRAPELAAPLSFCGAVAGGAGFLLIVLLNAEALVPLSLLRILLYWAAAQFTAVPLAYFCQGLDEPRLELVLFVLPVIAVWCVSFAYKTAPAAGRPNRTWPRYTFPWKLVALYAIYMFAYGLREQHLAAIGGAGMHSSLSTAIVTGGIMAVCLFAGRLPLSVLYRSPLLLMVCGFLLIPMEGLFGSVASGYLISMGMTLTGLLLGLLLFDLSKRMGIAIVALMGIEKAAYLFRIWGNDTASLLEASPLPVQTQDVVLMVAVIMLVLIGTFILLSEKELASRWGIRLLETGDLAEESRRTELIASRCDEITRTSRLSPREDEILRLLARGTSNQAIERELVIASGTLKAHIQHIYAKTGVHSKKELAALFEDAREDERQ